MNTCVYDNMFRDRDVYGLNVKGEDSGYDFLYSYVLGILDQSERILEYGCGTGQFAEMLLERGYDYIVGLDISKVGIDMSRRRCGVPLLFRHLDVLEYDHEDDYDVIVALEMLEHIKEDLAVIDYIPAGKRVVFSVPNYMSETHVRLYNDEDAIRRRYGKYFDDIDIKELKLPGKDRFKIFVCSGIRKEG